MNVLNAQFGIIKVGMPFELIKQIWSPIYDGGSGGYTSWTLRAFANHWYFKVNDKTGKVSSVRKLN